MSGRLTNTNLKAIGISVDKNGKIELSEENLKRLCNELEYCGKKIHSKTQTILKVSQDLSSTHSKLEVSERIAHKLELDVKREKTVIEGLKKQFENDYSRIRDKCNKMLKEMENLKKEKEYLLKENDQLKDEVRNLRRDCLSYRQKIAKLEIKEIGIEEKKIQEPIFEKELHIQIEEVEKLKKQNDQLKTDVSMLLGDKEELIKERDIMKGKAERLSQEIIYLLNGDPKALEEDVDSIISDNRFMKAQLENMKQETGMTKAALKKYRNLLGKKNKERIQCERESIDGESFDCEMEDFFSASPPVKALPSSSKTFFRGPKIVSFRQVKEILGSSIDNITENDYKTLTQLLVDYCNDKKLALTHQRNTNKILGKKISDMEIKIKNLEKNKERISKSPNKDIINEILLNNNEKQFSCKEIQACPEEIDNSN
uniref:Uncharacterized protein n=1 Tax=Parastrongyloides trichosuri TaxID=131310 RepID=A0A0N4ZXB8_PARTI